MIVTIKVSCWATSNFVDHQIKTKLSTKPQFIEFSYTSPNKERWGGNFPGRASFILEWELCDFS